MTGSRFIPVIAIVTMLASAASAQPAEIASSAKAFPLTVGSEWTYQVQFAVATPLWYDPYFIQPSLVATSVTHGTTSKLRGPGPGVSFTVKVTGTESPGVALVEVSSDGLHHWFAPTMINPKLAVASSTGTFPEGHPWMKKCEVAADKWEPVLPLSQPVEVLELRGTIQMDKEPKEPWILGRMLAAVPADGKSRIEKCGWLAEKSAEPVTVPAGTYTNVFHSRFKQGTGDETPPHVVESWVAPGVGLVKSTVLDSENKPRYSIVLTSVTIR